MIETGVARGETIEANELGEEASESQINEEK